MTNIKFLTQYIIFTLLLTFSALIMSPHALMAKNQQLPADTVTHQKYEKSKQPTFNQQDRFGDPFSNTQSPSPLLLEDPASLQLELEIDSAMNYTIFERIGALNYRPRSTMSFQEFNKYQDQRMKKDYFQNRSSGLDGESAVSGRRLIPKLYISPVFDRIFGGSYVDLEPNGFVNLDFGGQWQRSENPAVPVNQQRRGGFNFDQQISMNLVGKVGEKLAVTANFDNNNSFDYKNNMKIEYTGYDEDIIKKIELGNVSMSVANSLMTGGQNLFGIKTQLQFGKLYVTALASRQQGAVKNVSPNRNATGLNFGGSEGSSVGGFSMRATEYDEDRHFFLGHFFRDNYESWLSQMPRVVSGVNIIRLEVYVMNTNQETATLREMAAFLDLGEGDTLRNVGWKRQSGAPASNDANGLWNQMSTDNVLRDKTTIVDRLSSGSYGMEKGLDFENQLARKLEPREYTFNKQLGYISLQRKLSSNQFLAVAYQYTYKGQTYQVGELSTDYSGKPDEYIIFLKMLKPTSINPDLESWDLSMKNIYALGGRGMQQDGFELRINYRDDTKNYDSPTLNEGTNTANKQLIEVMGLDQLNASGDTQKDGKFDYVVDITVDEENGNIIFPVLEPFGSHLERQFTDQENALKDKYVFHELYENTPELAVNVTTKNKFLIYGVNPSSTRSEISLDGFNIEKGSVVILSGSENLIEGQDFQVDYNTGKVTLLRDDLNPDQLDIKYEQEDLFSGIQSKWLTGVRLDYQFSDKINLGATVFHVKERTRGASHFSIGNEPIDNTKYGFDANYDQPSRILTKAIDALPLISTKEESRVTFSGEFAQLRPGTSNDKQDKDGASFIEDFENAVTPRRFDGGHLPWSLASVPVGFEEGEGLASGNRRAKMAWYTVDRSFYSGSQPSNISDEDLAGHYVKAVAPQDIYKQQDLQQYNSNLSIFDLAYYPAERGPYNYNSSTNDVNRDGSFKEPEKNFGAIIRDYTGEADFTQNNIEYIEFWMMDPFIEGERGRRRVTGEENDVVVSEEGKLFFNVGVMSEDVLPNNQWERENGLPDDESNLNTVPTPWGRASLTTQVLDAFSNDASARINQDIGLDGVNSSREKEIFIDSLGVFSESDYDGAAYSALYSDPASDDFLHYLNSTYTESDAKILERYKKFNGVEGNSPIGSGNTSATLDPDSEDINNDSDVNTSNAYREFEVDLKKGMEIGESYIIDKVTDRSGEADWYQFRIPFSDAGAKDIGNYSIQNNRMIRMYMTGWKKPVVLRMANLSLVSSQWRKSTENLAIKGFDIVPEPSTAGFELSVVNIEENSTTSGGKPPYIVPLARDQDNSTTLSRRDNEQALKLCVEDLEDGDSRGAFKLLNQSLINYERLKMFFHAEQFDIDETINDDEMSAFLRLGIDQSENFYEIEVPLKITPYGLASYTKEIVWPEANEIDLAFDELKNLKKERNATGKSVLNPYSRPSSDGKYKLTIIGNPELSNVITMMVGVTNPKTEIDNDDKSLCIWANEIRVTGYNVNNGWAANANMSVKLADFATLKGSVRYESAGFGSIQDNVTNLGTDNFLDYDVSMDMAVDKLIPWKTGIKIPMRVGYAKSTITPTLDPLQNDLPIDIALDQIEAEQGVEERKAYKDIVQASSVRKSISFNNVHKEKVKKDAKSHIYDIENISFSYSYNETSNKNIGTVEDLSKNYSGNVNYAYSPQVPAIEPFKNVEGMSSPYLKFLKDLNFSPLPSSIGVTGLIDRRYQKTQGRNAELTTDGIDPTFQKSFNFNRNYNLRWNIFKSVNLDYRAAVTAVIDEPEGEIDTQAKRDSIMSNIKRLGRMKRYDQSVSASYRLPLDKFPLTEWISADYRYNVNYSWTAGTLSTVDDYGNDLRNERSQDVTGKFDLVKLYNKSKFLKSINTPARRRASSTRSRTPVKEDTTKNKTSGPMLKGFFRLLMMVRSVNVTLGKQESTFLPGFAMDPYLFGLSEGFEAPGAAFVFGDQNPNIRFKASDNNWLVKSSLQQLSFEQSLTNDIKLRANLEPFKDVKIQVDMKRSDQSNYSELYTWDDVDSFVSSLPVRSGSYTVSFLPIRTAFSKDGIKSHKIFSEFESNIVTMQNRLDSRSSDLGLLNYAENAQDAIIPAFIAAYTGSDVNTVKLSPVPKIPMPNWRIDYAGLSKLPVFKEIFSSVNITHAYVASYSIGDYVSDLSYTDPKEFDLSQNIIDYPLAYLPGSNGQTLTPLYSITQVTISERFSPLIGVNIRTKNKITSKVEWKKERNLVLNISNSQMIERVSDDLAFDFGITKSDLKIPFKIQGRSVTLENDIQFRTTFTIKNTRTVQRKVNDEHTITEGNLSWQFRPNVTYVANKKLNVTMYYERNINQPKLTTSFNRASTSFGIQLRFSLAQ